MLLLTLVAVSAHLPFAHVFTSIDDGTFCMVHLFGSGLGRRNLAGCREWLAPSTHPLASEHPHIDGWLDVRRSITRGAGECSLHQIRVLLESTTGLHLAMPVFACQYANGVNMQ